VEESSGKGQEKVLQSKWGKEGHSLKGSRYYPICMDLKDIQGF